MLILGIDTSCDDTSASIVEDGTKILSNIVSSQEIIHEKYGGIVPELASRRHLEMIWPVVDEALNCAKIRLEDLAAIAVCHGPGLIGSLLVGCSFAKALSFSRDIPLVAVNHLEGHIFACFLESAEKQTPPEFPFLSLVVSGGHTSLYRIDGFGRCAELGRTRDDAAGEAFDKTSKLLGLGYPGGPVIDRLSQTGNPKAIDFPRAYLPDSLDFSFSGLKTAVAKYLKTHAECGERKAELNPKSQNPALCTPHSAFINDICAGFQQAVVDVVIQKVEWAMSKEQVYRVTVSGGVAANNTLRKELGIMAERTGGEIFTPLRSLCTDNAAMIAAAGYMRFLQKHVAGLDLNPAAYMPLSSLELPL